MLIFGWGQTTKRKLSKTAVSVCEGCHADYLYLTRILTWFTLFFIPFIPYNKEYYLLCPNCKSGYEIDEKETNVEELIDELEECSQNSSKTEEKEK
jgi:hypothetical protein